MADEGRTVQAEAGSVDLLRLQDELGERLPPRGLGMLGDAIHTYAEDGSIVPLSAHQAGTVEDALARHAPPEPVDAAAALDALRAARTVAELREAVLDVFDHLGLLGGARP